MERKFGVVIFLPCDVTKILKIRASPRLGDDVIAWGPERLGDFCVKSAYEAFEETCRMTSVAPSLVPNGSRSCWKIISGSNVPPTIKNFAWRVAVNSLPTWENRHKRGLEESDACPVCDIETESSFHALCRCPLTVDLWNYMGIHGVCQEWEILGI